MILHLTIEVLVESHVIASYSLYTFAVFVEMDCISNRTHLSYFQHRDVVGVTELVEI